MKKIRKIVLIILLIVVALGFALNFLSGGILQDVLFDRPVTPKTKKAEFPFEIVYEYNNEQFTVNETIVCEYEGISFKLEGGNSRDWNCYITNNDDYGRYYLDKEKYPSLYVQIPLEADYYMGDPDANPEFSLPYIFFIDESTGTTYYEQDLSSVIGAKIISFKLSEPLVNNIK